MDNYRYQLVEEETGDTLQRSNSLTDLKRDLVDYELSAFIYDTQTDSIIDYTGEEWVVTKNRDYSEDDFVPMS